jgi:hypothetical protein
MRHQIPLKRKEFAEIEKLDFTYDTIADFENRLSALLPVKPGDKLYTANEDGIDEWVIANFSMLGELVWPEFEEPEIKHIYAQSESGEEKWFSLYDIGNEVFLDRDGALDYKAGQFGLTKEEEEEYAIPFN